MLFLPFKVSTSSINIRCKISYQDAKQLYIKSNKKASDINELFDIINNQKPVNDTVHNCGICLEQIDDNRRELTKCKHILHESCFLQYSIVFLNKQCPICRTDLDEQITIKKKKTKQKLAKKIKQQLDKSRNKRREVIERYTYYESIKMQFQFITDLYESAIQFPAYPDLSSDDDYNGGDLDEPENVDIGDEFDEYIHRIRERVREQPLIISSHALFLMRLSGRFPQGPIIVI